MPEFFNALLYNAASPMVFHSVLFIILFTLFYAVYLLVHKNIFWRNLLLIFFSLYFYFKISGIYVFLLIFVAGSDFLIGKAIFTTNRAGSKRALVVLSLIISIGALVFFKYANFFLNGIFNTFTGHQSPYIVDLLAPVGISYYVFKTLTYTIGIYRGDIEAYEKRFDNYLLYVSFFPNILSGPISRARDLLPQFRLPISLSYENASRGFFLILTGAFKKIVIADFIALNLVDRIFESPEYFSGFEILMGSIGYTLQLYFDFSGYTDIVIGIALLLGFTILSNFNKPFLSSNVTDFWRRWHITLSTWIRDYMFTPMSVNLRRWGKAGLITAILISFIICGLWHGPAITFVLWGAAHGLAMGWDILTGKLRTRIKKNKSVAGVYSFISIGLTFFFICLAFVIFRTPDLETAGLMYNQIFTSVDFGLAAQWVELYTPVVIVMAIALFLGFIPLKWSTKAADIFSKQHWLIKALAVSIGIILIYQVYSTDAQAFIYLTF